ncbi:MAG: SGNH/GDSL hydrolase family protein [Actinobacteria bacterium]|uniref:Unannotated protein n=1 Tax=freshwater metagenome TaxID=449393 RepID=A0A6J5ZDM0_9ZZZZ|nr:SGNH/GDSL hydrolase family protein [Actinomycetota bacterium]
MPTYNRFIAFGDSITEGLSDIQVNGVYLGWADRVAQALGRESGQCEYFNLAIRGKRLEQVVEDQLPLGMPYVDGADTLVSFHAGANNILRPGYDPSSLLPMYSHAAQSIASTGAHLLLFTVQEIQNPQSRTQSLWNQRFGPFNENVRQTARDTGAYLLDGNTVPVFFDRRLISADRLHLNEEGHRRVAAAVLEKLGLPHDLDWREPLGEMPHQSVLNRISNTASWTSSFLVPWTLRRLTGKSSGDGRKPKHTEPVTILAAID